MSIQLPTPQEAAAIVDETLEAIAMQLDRPELEVLLYCANQADACSRSLSLCEWLKRVLSCEHRRRQFRVAKFPSLNLHELSDEQLACGLVTAEAWRGGVASGGIQEFLDTLVRCYIGGVVHRLTTKDESQ